MARVIAITLAAFGVSGALAQEGDVVDLSELEFDNLSRRGKVRAATADEAAEHAEQVALDALAAAEAADDDEDEAADDSADDE